MKTIKILLILALFSIFTILSKESYAYGFGVKKNDNHQQPDIGFYQDIIKKNGGFYVGDNKSKKVYLTFDCGYENGYTSSILDTLKQKKISAAFFITGHYIDTAPQLVLRMKNEGHLVCNHSNLHKNITTLSEEEIIKEMSELNGKYIKLTGEDIAPFFRPPAGNFTLKSLEVVSKSGYIPLFWSLAYHDWDKEYSDSFVINEISSNIHPGAIILLHAVTKANASSLEGIITTIEDAGYEFCDLFQLIN